jgi:rSAM/selenodomain-associated transferase 1
MEKRIDKSRCVIVFVKAPEKGQVKVRLAQCIGEDVACEIYRNFVLDLMDRLSEGDFDLRVCFNPPQSKDKMAEWLGREHCLVPQTGEDLGRKMENAFRLTFIEGYKEVLLVGSDVPDLEACIVDRAFESLRYDDLVLGPSSEGGYYLIGFKSESFIPDIFQGVQWNTSQVLNSTMLAARKRGRTVHVMPRRRDMDTVEDLQALMEESRGMSFENSRTISYLRKCEGIFKKKEEE